VSSRSPERGVEDASSSKISPASRPGAGSALSPPRSPAAPLARAPSSLSRARRSLVIPDAHAALPSPLSLAVQEEETAREERGGN
jgi:hypothetical protein